MFLLLIISCADKKPDNQTSEFVKVLGIENVATLDFLVSDFENDFLKRQYPNLDTENAYRRFLTELRDEKTENWKSISDKARNKFNASDLRIEMYEFPDSVWIIENSDFDKIESDSLDYIRLPAPYVKSRYKFTKPDGTTEYSYSRSSAEDISRVDYDSIINRELNSLSFNYTGKYLSALESVKNRSEFLSELYKVKSSFGILMSYEVAEIMLEFNVNLNDSLIRKIIVTEIVY
jgi:hypothetical protein